jgi:hypothetical protein
LKKVPETLFPKMGDETEEEVKASEQDYEALKKQAFSNK